MCRVVVLLAALAAASPFSSVQAQGADARMAGQWQCSTSANDPSGRLVTSVTRYVLALYPNGSFSAQGQSQGGTSQMSFQAQGNWRVWQENGKWYLAAQGQQVSVWSNGMRVPGNHMTFGQIYSLTQFGYRQTTQDGRTIAALCQRAG